MKQLLQIRVSPKQANDSEYIDKLIAKECGVKNTNNLYYRIKKRSIDARQKQVKIQLTIEVSDIELSTGIEEVKFKNVEHAKTIHIIGAGPAGLFAALKAIEIGLKPIIFERGKNVRDRRRDLAQLNKEHIVNPESNYCFGEGGAGTYSDGKLYTRSKKRGDINRVLQLLVQFGADEDILINAHPHIGTNKLPKIITSIREKIIEMGGEIHFQSKLTDLVIKNGKIHELIINNENIFPCNQLILATGHSARDIFQLLYKKGIQMEFKSFALGIRIEHPQELIDKIQYHCNIRDEYLPPATYKMVTQTSLNRGVFSFCMCPGGIIAPCATDIEEVVTNGWSPSKRNNPYANSGIVAEINEEDVNKYGIGNPLKGVLYQKEIENKAWIAGGKTQTVPAQRMIDFIENKVSNNLPKTSYTPGIISTQLSEVLPKIVCESLAEALKIFGQKNKGYLTNEAVLHAVESRTSSPIRIPRNHKTLEHPQIKGLYPCGEGAGYAGGIMSAAIDGMRCVEAIAKAM